MTCHGSIDITRRKPLCLTIIQSEKVFVKDEHLPQQAKPAYAHSLFDKGHQVSCQGEICQTGIQ